MRTWAAVWLMLLAMLAGAGTAHASDVRWLPPATATPGVLGPPVVAMSRSGWVAVASGDAIGSNLSIAVRPPGGTFTSTTITLPAAGMGPPALAVGESGLVTVAVVNAGFPPSTGPVLVYAKRAQDAGFAAVPTSGVAAASAFDPVHVVVTADDLIVVGAPSAGAVFLATGPPAGPLTAAATPVAPSGQSWQLIADAEGRAALVFCAIATPLGSTHALLGVLRREPGRAFERVGGPFGVVDETAPVQNPAGLSSCGATSARFVGGGAIELLWLPGVASLGPASSTLRGGLLREGDATLAAADAARVVAAVSSSIGTGTIIGASASSPLPGGGATALVATATPPGPTTAVTAYTRTGADGSWVKAVPDVSGATTLVDVIPSASAPGGAQAIQLTGSQVVAYQRQADGSYVSDTAIATATAPDTLQPGPAATDGADAAVAFTRVHAGVLSSEVAIYDNSAPVARSVSVPSPTAGSPATFAVDAFDAFSPPPVTAAWAFGDGATASGASVDHAFGAPGSFAAQLTLTDAVGNSAVSDLPVTVGAAGGAGDGGGGGGGGAVKDTVRPGVSKVKLAPKRVKRKRARTKLSFVLSEAATVTVKVTRQVPGRKSGKRCLPTSRKVARKSRCRAVRSVTSRTAKSKAGAGSISLALSRLNPAGTYKLTLTAKDAAGNVSKAVGVNLVVTNK